MVSKWGAANLAYKDWYGTPRESPDSVPGSFSKNMQAAELARKGITVVSVEGGIGVGKSTVMTHLRKVRPDLLYIDEPVDLWEKAGLLDAMYKGTIPPGTFQIAALSTRMAPLLKAVREGHQTIVTERCPWSDFEVFTKANLAPDSIELTAYKMAYDALMTAVPTPVTLYNLYLTADVGTLIRRMERRARDRSAQTRTRQSRTVAPISTACRSGTTTFSGWPRRRLACPSTLARASTLKCPPMPWRTQRSIASTGSHRRRNPTRRPSW